MPDQTNQENKNQSQPQSQSQPSSQPSSHVVDLRQQAAPPVSASAPGQNQQQPQPQQPQQFQQQPAFSPPPPGYPAPPQYYGQPPQMPQPPQPPQKKGGLTSVLLGCCIFLLLIQITIWGLGVYYLRQGVTVLRQKGISDFQKFLEDKFGNLIKTAIEKGAQDQLQKFGSSLPSISPLPSGKLPFDTTN